MEKYDQVMDFAKFIIGKAAIPKRTEVFLFDKVHRELHPHLVRILAKFFSLHVAGAVVTLTFCAQFGLSLGSSATLLSKYLLHLNPALCFLTCGAVWILAGQSLSYLLLTIDEQRVLGQYRWWAASCVIGASYFLFVLAGSFHSFEWSIFWILGALLVASLFNWRVSKKIPLRTRGEAYDV